MSSACCELRAFCDASLCESKALLSSALDVFSASSCCTARRSASFRLAQTDSFTASKVVFAQAEYNSNDVCCSCVAARQASVFSSNAFRCASAVLAASVLCEARSCFSTSMAEAASVLWASKASFAEVLCESRSCFTASRAEAASVLWASRAACADALCETRSCCTTSKAAEASAFCASKAACAATFCASRSFLTASEWSACAALMPLSSALWLSNFCSAKT
mmetsp:Transcript_30070/g.86564  ORF Transcript_30070/g.86564 Transcript_30070/m.86564 type:complete len:222 (-) Transcript_30070:453-1118(-)